MDKVIQEQSGARVPYLQIGTQIGIRSTWLQITFSYKPVICQARDKV